MHKAIFLAGGLLLALAGCGEGAADEGGANAATQADESAEAHGEETATARLLLSAEGITPGSDDDSAMIGFGANSLDTIEQVTPLLGDNYDQDASDECGAGPMEFANFGPVVLMFREGEFVGWEQREASENPWIGTPGGATIGSPRADLETALGAPVSVEASSLGVEFSGGGYSGLLSADAPDATVTALWAGTNCAMR